MVVVGEVVNKILERETDKEKISDKIYGLVKLIKEKMRANIQPASNEALKLACECLELDNHLTPTDSIILAQALSDRNSIQLFTFDAVLTTSLRLQEFEEELRKEGKRLHKLRISPISP